MIAENNRVEPEEITGRIKHIIREKGLKQIFVAEKAGLDSKQFSDILNGRRALRVEYLNPIADALGVDVRTLIRGGEKNHDR